MSPVTTAHIHRLSKFALMKIARDGADVGEIRFARRKSDERR